MCGLVRKRKPEEFKECTDLCVDAAVTQRPRFTRVLTHRTHDGRVGFTNLFTEERRSRSDQLASSSTGSAGRFFKLT